MNGMDVRVRRITPRTVVGRPWRAMIIIAGWLLAANAWTIASATPEVWVVTDGSSEIYLIDPATASLIVDPDNPIDIDDPDGDGTPDPPGGLEFSTVVGQNGTHAFVTQGRLLTVISVATRQIVQLHDIGDLLAASTCPLSTALDVTLRGMSASPPRRFDGGGGGVPVVKSYLHVAATTSGGQAGGVILDQEMLIGGGGNPLVDCVALEQGATALDVKVLNTAAGPLFQRAWYAMAKPGLAAPVELFASRVGVTDQLGSPWTVGPTLMTTLPLGAATPGALGIGAPLGRELPVFPEGAIGGLVNLDNDLRCDPGGDLVDVSVSGCGPNSYTVIALDQLNNRALFVDAVTCDDDPIDVGDTPVDVETLGWCDWREAYVANRGDDSVSIIRRDGMVDPVPLGMVPAGDCVLCPIAVGVANRDLCVPDRLQVNPVDADGDGLLEGTLLSWSQGDCEAPVEYLVKCLCLTDGPDCPCRGCDCADPSHPPECCCPGLDAADPGTGPISPDLQIKYGLPPDHTNNPWIILTITPEMMWEHDFPETDEDSWIYDVEPNDEQP